MRYLTRDELISINRQVIERAGEGSVGIQYPEGLDLVVEQPQMIVFGQELYRNIWLKAAYILQKITKKHIFSDGNKRTAYIATKLFLAMNNYHLTVSKTEGVALMLGTTVSEDTEDKMIQIAEFLKEHSKKIDHNQS